MAKYIPKEIVDKAKQVDLLTFLSNYNPSELVQKGIGTYSTKTHDSLIISNGLWHRFSNNHGGKSAVDYLIKEENMSLPEAVERVMNVGTDRTIYSLIEDHEYKTDEQKSLVIPQRASNNKQVIDYLINRGIDDEIVQDMIDKKLIYQESKTNNVVFLGYDYDGNIKYAGCRATDNKRFFRDAKGSNKEFSFRLVGSDNNPTLNVFESSIDLLSYATLLKEHGFDYKNQNLLALAGIYQPSQNVLDSKVPIAIKDYIEHYNNISNVVLHFDNDSAGRNATKGVISAITREYKNINVYDIPAPYGKDINDYLCYKLGLKSRQEIEQYKVKMDKNRTMGDR